MTSFRLVQRRKRCGRPIRERTMRSLAIVMVAKLRQFPSRIFQRCEPLNVQTLVAQPAIETFDESVLYRTTWPNEAQLHIVGHGPGFQRTAAELTAVVHCDSLRQMAPLVSCVFQRLRHFHPRHGTISFQPNALPRELVHYRQGKPGDRRDVHRFFCPDWNSSFKDPLLKPYDVFPEPEQRP